MGSGKGLKGGGGTKCVKYLVLFCNLLFFLLGLAILGIGIWSEVKLKEYFELEVLKSYAIDSGPRIIIAAGCVVTIVAFLGCCGAWKESKCMLICFFVCMLILFCLEIAAAVLAFVKKDKVKDELENELKNQIKSYTGSARNAVDDMQKTVKCCGITTYEDWKSSDNLGLTDNVPDSCCTTVEKDCGMGQRKTPTRIYKEGCYMKIKKDIDNNLVAVGAVTITILVIQLLAMIFAMFLVCRID